MKVSEIRDKVITGSFAIAHEGLKEPCSALGMDGWEFYAKRLEVMVSMGEFDSQLISEERIEGLAKIYEKYPWEVAIICDDVLDKSGALLGKVRKAALKELNK